MPAPQTLPYSSEAEQSILGAMMLSHDTIQHVRSQLSDSDFFVPAHRELFRMIRESIDSGLIPDAVTLSESIPTDSSLTPAFITGVASDTWTIANLDSYIKVVRSAAAKRELIDIGMEITARGYNCATPEEIIPEGMVQLTRVLSRVSQDELDPADLFADEPSNPLLPEYLPPGIAEYAVEQARLVGIQPELIAMGCLGAIAAAVHDGIKLQPQPNNTGWLERACLWILVVAPPGSKKSPAMERALQPLRHIDRKLQSAYAKESAAYGPAAQEYAERRKQHARRSAKGEGYDDVPAAPDKPKDLCVFVNDYTSEALGEVLVDNDRGVLVHADEVKGWFSAQNGYGKGGEGRGRAIALQAYGGGQFKFNRVGRGSVVVPNLSFSLVATTQPDTIREVIANEPDDGLLPRFMICEVERGEPIYPDENFIPNKRTTATYYDTLETVWNFKPADGGTIVQMSPEAAELAVDMRRFATRTAQSGALPKMMAGHISKWEGLWARLALVYHCWGCAMAGKHPASMPISGKTAKRVSEFMLKFLMPQGLRFYRCTVGSTDEGHVLSQRIAAMILAEGITRLTTREIHRGTNLWRDASTWHRQAAIQSLKDSGWLLSGEGRSTSRDETSWLVNPRVHIRFAARARQETVRRQLSADSLAELRHAAGMKAEPPTETIQ